MKEKKEEKTNPEKNIKKTPKPGNDKKLTIKDKTKKEKKPRANLQSINFNLIEVLVIMFMTSLLVGVSTNFFFLSKENSYNYTLSDSSEYLDEFLEVYNNILTSYVEEVDESILIEAAIKAIYDQLEDPYTSYLDEETSAALEERLEGEYQGIGIEISKNYESGYIYIETVFEDTPASTSGILQGDYIIEINGNSVIDESTTSVAEIIKSNESNILTILREDEELYIKVSTTNVVIPSVTSEIFGTTGYLKIDTFSNTTYSQFKTLLEELEDEGIDNLIIDVRDNGGGYLDAATDIIELFLEKDKIIYQFEVQDEITDIYKDQTSESRDYEIAILINSSSASASEILAAALKESYQATLIGTTTYGKGSVQEKTTLSTGEIIKYTTAYWLTPNGNSINEIGISPDVTVTLSSYVTYSYEIDTQLQKAIESLKN